MALWEVGPILAVARELTKYSIRTRAFGRKPFFYEKNTSFGVLDNTTNQIFDEPISQRDNSTTIPRTKTINADKRVERAAQAYRAKKIPFDLRCSCSARGRLLNSSCSAVDSPALDLFAMAFA